MSKQITQEQIDLIVERLIRRVQEANTYFLIEIGDLIKKIRNLTPSKAQQLIQMLKYNGDIEEIINEIARYTKMNIADIDKIFKNYAENDLNFYEEFYRYRNIPFEPFEENKTIKMQTEALSNIAKNEMYNFTRENVIGYTIHDVEKGKKGKTQFYGLKETYNRVLDEAFLTVSQGKESFDNSMKRIMEDIGGSGLKTLNYESGRSIRLDSAIRMHMNGRLAELHNENQKIIGDIIGSDGVEITVHSNPAPDHQLAQGRQFKNEEFEKLQRGEEATDTKGVKVNLDHDHKNGYRPIGEMNCYHLFFTIVLGVSEPEYSEEQLKEIIDRNNKGFNFDKKHYSMYQGEQLQRKIETEIRKQKDIQILAKTSGDKDLMYSSQDKIRMLTNKYYQLSKKSGLPTKLERLQINNYKKVAK